MAWYPAMVSGTSTTRIIRSVVMNAAPDGVWMPRTMNRYTGVNKKARTEANAKSPKNGTSIAPTTNAATTSTIKNDQ